MRTFRHQIRSISPNSVVAHEIVLKEQNVAPYGLPDRHPFVSLREVAPQVESAAGSGVVGGEPGELVAGIDARPSPARSRAG